jgi:tetratricopeptide (TPR) repeat protein
VGRWPIVSVGSDVTQVLAGARAAFARGNWGAAREAYEEALAIEQSGEALYGLARSSWWLGDAGAAVELCAKAFDQYRREGNSEDAADVAIFLAAEYRLAGNASLANGWLGRGRRLLADGQDCAALGWLHVELSKRAAKPEDAERSGSATPGSRLLL